jgi:hypothetical protein
MYATHDSVKSVAITYIKLKRNIYGSLLLDRLFL